MKLLFSKNLKSAQLKLDRTTDPPTGYHLEAFWYFLAEYIKGYSAKIFHTWVRDPWALVLGLLCFFFLVSLVYVHQFLIVLIAKNGLLVTELLDVSSKDL